jgi:hypothetical protein
MLTKPNHYAGWPNENMFSAEDDILLYASLYRTAAQWDLVQLKARNKKISGLLGRVHSILSERLATLDVAHGSSDYVDPMLSLTEIARERFLVDDTYYHVMFESKHQSLERRISSQGDQKELTRNEKGANRYLKSDSLEYIDKRKKRQNERLVELSNLSLPVEMNELTARMMELERQEDRYKKL